MLTTNWLLDEMAGRLPDKQAVVDHDRALTFSELRSEVRQAAAAMIAMGVDRGDRVAIWAPNTWRWVVACLATHYAGAVLVPINTGYSDAEAGDVLARSGAVLLIAGGDSTAGDRVASLDRETIPALRHVVRVAVGADHGDRDWDEFVEGPKADQSEVEVRAASVTPDDLSDILFTSGTTGRSKGVMCAHRQSLSASAAWAEGGRITSADRYLCINPFFHSFGYKAGILACLQTGATLFPHSAFDPEKVMADIAEHRITVLPGPPAVYQMLLDHPARGIYDLSSLRFAVTGAATIPAHLIERMQRELDIDIVLTAYGLTEASGFGTMCRPGDDPVTVATTCGRPIADFDVLIREPDRTGAGEVLLRGPNVMLGYFADPESTAAAIDADGWLRTGDVGVIDESGNLRITDRLTDMYVCAGYNVYPAEVEQVLARLDEVFETAVVGVPDPLLGEVGRAIVVTAPGAQLDEQAVIAYARKRLAEYKVPRSVVFVDALPRNSSGKVLKTALRSTFTSPEYDPVSQVVTRRFGRPRVRPDAPPERVAPRTALEFEIHRLWELVLNSDDFGVTDSFVEAGGGSLASAHLMVCLTQQLGCVLPMSFISRLPTIAEQAAWIASVPRGDRASLVELASVGGSGAVCDAVGSGAPVFIIPCLGPEIFDFIPLARAMAPYRPLLGLRAADLGSEDQDVELVAAHYAEVILKRQPDGPINLLGFSAGGWYAHAVAAELLNRGANLGRLLVLDSQPFAPGKATITPACVLDWRLYAGLLPLQLARLASRVRHHPRAVLVRLGDVRDRRRLQLRGRSPGPASEGALQKFDDHRSPFVRYFSALRRHKPRRLQVATNLFGPPETMALLRRTWRFYTGADVRAEVVFDDHNDLWCPDRAPELAVALQRILDSSDSDSAEDGPNGLAEAQTPSECLATAVPDDVDVDALSLRYRIERDRRVRDDGSDQYIQVTDELAGLAVDPFSTPMDREPIRNDICVAVVGGGLAGLLCAAALKKNGVEDVTIIDGAGDFGGVWYWNRYPGVQCDTDAYCYLPLLEELKVIPTRKYVDGAEVYEHCRRIGAHFGLYDRAVFSTLVKALRWDDSIARWRIATNRGDEIRAQFVVMASGPFYRPKLPGIPGIREFEGRSFHSSRWDYAYTGGDSSGGLVNLADKRVALIGTGATGVQLVPHLGRYAKHLYVFQRTPSTITERHNPETDPEWFATLAPGWQKERQRNFHAWTTEGFASGQPDLVCDFWTELGRNTVSGLIGSDLMTMSPVRLSSIREREDYRLMEKIRRRVDAVVEDPRTAEALKPYYRFGCKRPCSSNEFLDTFNLPNVTLIDVSGSKGVERATDTGLVANGVEYEVDCIVYASGFEITTDISRRYDIDVIEGRAGVSLYDKWRDDVASLHGMTTRDFPNQFFTGFTQGGVTANVTASYEVQAEHIAYIIAEAVMRNAKTIEPTQEAQDRWRRILEATGGHKRGFEINCTPGYFNNEGRGGSDGIWSRLGRAYRPGLYAFADLLADWRDAGDLEGFAIET